MAKNSELNMLLTYILGVDISFVIEDIIGDYEDPDIPVNIDYENFSIDVETPCGICNITTKYVDDFYIVIFKKCISDSYYEEYTLSLVSVDYFCLHGRNIEVREKGYVTKHIEKIYVPEILTKDSKKMEK